VSGDVGDIEAFLDVWIGDDYPDSVNIGGNLGSVTSLASRIEIDNIDVLGNVADITAFQAVYIEDFDVGGNVGDITSLNDEIGLGIDSEITGSVGDVTAFKGIYIEEFDVGGNVGDLTSLNEDIEILNDTDISGSIGDIWAADWVHFDDLEVLGSIGDITSAVDWVEIYDTEVGGSVGDITAFEDIIIGNEYDNGYGGEGGLLVGGDLGSVVAQKGDISIDVTVNGNIEDVYAEEGEIYDSLIVSGGNIGNFTAGTGVRAAEAIWDDVTIVAKGTIGVVESYALGYSLESTATFEEIVSDEDGILDGENDILLPDNDLIFDFQNDYLVFDDSTGDDVIEISPIIEAYMQSSGDLPDGDYDYYDRIDLLDDGIIDSAEALDIIDFAGEELPDITDPAYGGIITTVFQEVFKEVEIIDVDDVVDVPDIEESEVPYPNEYFLTIIAEGLDPSSSVRAIGRISSTGFTSSDLYVDAVRGGIGEFSSYGVLGLSDADTVGLTDIEDYDFGGGDTLTNAIIRAKTSIDTLRGDDAIINLDIKVTASTTIDMTKLTNGVDNDGDGLIDEFDEAITSTGGVGLVGGIISNGDIEINLVTGGSIGPTLTTGGSVNSNYDAFGNISSIVAKHDVTGTYVAATGFIGSSISTAGGVTTVHGGVTALAGDIDADFTAGVGVGTIAAPVGNVSGSVKTAGVFHGDGPSTVVEAAGSDDDDFTVIYDASALAQFSETITLDTESSTSAPSLPSGFTWIPGGNSLLGDTLQFTGSSGSTQVISIEGSSSSLRVSLDVIFGTVIGVNITGNGSLTFNSTGDVGDMTVGFGANVSVSSVFVDGDLGGFVNVNNNAKIQNIEATENIGSVIGSGSIKNIKADGSIDEVKSILKDVKTVYAGDDIDSIFAGTNVTDIKAQGEIGEIIAAKNVKIVEARELGTLSALNVNKVIVTGDIDFISAAGNVTDVASSGDIEVAAGRNAVKISGASGKVSFGGKFSRISPNLEIDPWVPPVTP
jgi:hypothetical protein